jgi:hypothetical protein
MRLSFRTEDGEPFEIMLHGVSHFKCDNFRQGNIVFDVEQVSAGDILSDEFEALLYLKKDERPDFSTKIMAKLESGELKFLRIGSSYGAEISAIFRRLEVLGNKTS